MGYTSYGYGQLVWNSIQLEDGALVLNDGNTKPFVQTVGGVYRAVLPTYTAGDAAVMHFTADGKLMVDTELTLDGNVIIDNVAVFATNIASSATAGFALIDANGHVQVDVLTMPGSLTGYAEDTAHVTADIGIQVLSKRTDSPSSSAGTDGDYATFNTDSAGRLWVTGTYIEDSPHASGNQGVMSLAVRNDNNTSLVGTDGDYSPIGVSSTGGLILAGYDEVENATATTESNPISQHHTEDTLATATAQTDTAGTYYYFDADDYKNFAVQIENTSGAAGSNVYTVEASLQDDGTAQASCSYFDVTNQWFGVANVTDSNAWLEMDSVCIAKYVRVKVVRTGDAGNNDGAWTLYLKRLY